MPDFLSIPGNIRQQYMPFTIEGPEKRQLFSFKRSRAKEVKTAIGIINPFSRYVQDLFLNDSGIQYTHGIKGSSKLTYNDFLDSIPAIQIREYVPDAKITQTFKWFSHFRRGITGGIENADSMSFDKDTLKKSLTSIANNFEQKMKELTSGDAPLLKKIVGDLSHEYQDKRFNIGSDNGYAVLFMPFLLYYRLTTTNTNNIYELPYSMNNDLMKADGTYGWTTGASDYSFLDKLATLVEKNSAAQFFLGNTIKVNLMPSFQPSGKFHSDTITINIDLINDSADAAVSNFLMCHTLFGNAKWLQYGLVQAGSSVYDVKLPGAHRYFMCTGNFTCKGKGIFRTPNDAICNAIINCSHPMKTFGEHVYVVGEKNSPRQLEIDRRAEEMANQAIDQTFTAQNQPTGSSFKKRDGEAENIATQQLNQRIIQTSYTDKASANTSIVMSNTAMVGSRNLYSSVKSDTSISISNDQKVLIERLSDANANLANRKENFENAKSDVILRQTEFKLAKIEEEAAFERVRQIDKEKNPEDYIKAVEEWREAEKAVIEARTELSNAEQKLETVQSELHDVETTANDIKNELVDSYRAKATENVDVAYGADGKGGAAVITVDDIKDRIKIPDVYSLTLTFQSLIPDNFNNYLYGFRNSNLDPIGRYANEGSNNKPDLGVFEKLVQQLEGVLLGG